MHLTDGAMLIYTEFLSLQECFRRDTLQGRFRDQRNNEIVTNLEQKSLGCKSELLSENVEHIHPASAGVGASVNVFSLSLECS